MDLLKDARDVIMATAYVTVMRYVWNGRQREQAWQMVTPRRRAAPVAAERPSQLAL